MGRLQHREPRNVYAGADIHSFVAINLKNAEPTVPSKKSDPLLTEIAFDAGAHTRSSALRGPGAKPSRVSPYAPPDASPEASRDAISDGLDPSSLRPTAPRAGNAAKRAVSNPNRGRLNLYLLRHASAGTRRTNPKVDVKRPLDKEGKQQCFQLAFVLNALKLNFDLIVSSPLKRCLQTAQLIGTETGYEAKILHADALRPDGEFAQFQRLVHECRSYESVLMVGHNPTLTYFLGQMIGAAGTEVGPSATAHVRLRKGSMARVTLDRGPALLQWMLEPRIVRALYTTSTKSSRRKTSRK